MAGAAGSCSSGSWLSVGQMARRLRETRSLMRHHSGGSHSERGLLFLRVSKLVQEEFVTGVTTKISSVRCLSAIWRYLSPRYCHTQLTLLLTLNKCKASPNRYSACSDVERDKRIHTTTCYTQSHPQAERANVTHTSSLTFFSFPLHLWARMLHRNHKSHDAG